MQRIDALRAIYPHLEDCVVITIMGAVSAELQSLGHRSGFFYLLHAMGLAPSMGLGIALARPELKVVVLDGDGSVLMNLGGLTTMARYRPPNLTHLIFDNESLLSVGGFPTATATGTDLAAIATGAGVESVYRSDNVESLQNAFVAAQAANDLSVIVAKVDATGPATFITDLPMLENRFQFQRHLKPASSRKEQT
jgi:sulfopyruvate decarboxylase subunit beta